MDTVRIELDGDYAIVLKEMKHKTSKLVMEMLRSCMPPSPELVPLATITDPSKIADAMIDLNKVKATGEQRAELILLNQAVEWSFGPVTQETLDNMSTAKYQKLAAEVDRLYTVPLAGNK